MRIFRKSKRLLGFSLSDFVRLNGLLFLLLIQACTGAANSSLERIAKKSKLSEFVVKAGDFALPAYASTDLTERWYEAVAGQTQPSIEQLHVYLEGDGRPWLSESQVSLNPTSQTALALKLMLEDSAPSIYLNRPCYGLRSIPDACNPSLWTQARYSEAVVDALDLALDDIKQALNVQEFVLIGHSGGGSLAILLGAKRSDLAKVITVAANLDHMLWTAHFSYSPLHESLNPIDVIRAVSSLEQWHFVGTDDRLVPAELIYRTFELEHRPSSSIRFEKVSELINVVTLPGFDHHCCWKKSWHKLLSSINSTN